MYVVSHNDIRHLFTLRDNTDKIYSIVCNLLSHSSVYCVTYRFICSPCLVKTQGTTSYFNVYWQSIELLLIRKVSNHEKHLQITSLVTGRMRKVIKAEFLYSLFLFAMLELDIRRIVALKRTLKIGCCMYD